MRNLTVITIVIATLFNVSVNSLPVFDRYKVQTSQTLSLNSAPAVEKRNVSDFPATFDDVFSTETTGVHAGTPGERTAGSTKSDGFAGQVIDSMIGAN